MDPDSIPVPNSIPNQHMPCSTYQPLINPIPYHRHWYLSQWAKRAIETINIQAADDVYKRCKYNALQVRRKQPNSVTGNFG